MTAGDAVTTRQGGNVLGKVSNFLLFQLCNITSISNKHGAVKIFTSAADVTALVKTKDCDSYPDNYFANLQASKFFAGLRRNVITWRLSFEP